MIKYGRLPNEQLPRDFASIPPDLAVEVLTPSDLYCEFERKVREYLSAGVQRVWVINTDFRTVRIHRPDRTIVELDEDKMLIDEEVLPGFSAPVRSLFSSQSV